MSLAFKFDRIYLLIIVSFIEFKWLAMVDQLLLNAVEEGEEEEVAVEIVVVGKLLRPNILITGNGF